MFPLELRQQYAECKVQLTFQQLRWNADLVQLQQSLDIVDACMLKGEYQADTLLEALSTIQRHIPDTHLYRWTQFTVDLLLALELLDCHCKPPKPCPK